MAKNKQQKKKDRERRVAQKKLEATAKRRSLEKSAKETEKEASKKSTVMSSAIPKTNHLPVHKKNPSTRRTGG